MSIARMMLVVGLIAADLAVLNAGFNRCYTSFDTGPRGWADPGRYSEFDIGPCRLVYQHTARGRWLEFQPAWAQPTVLWRD